MELPFVVPNALAACASRAIVASVFFCELVPIARLIVTG